MGLTRRSAGFCAWCSTPGRRRTPETQAIFEKWLADPSSTSRPWSVLGLVRCVASVLGTAFDGCGESSAVGHRGARLYRIFIRSNLPIDLRKCRAGPLMHMATHIAHTNIVETNAEIKVVSANSSNDSVKIRMDYGIGIEAAFFPATIRVAVTSPLQRARSLQSRRPVMDKNPRSGIEPG